MVTMVAPAFNRFALVACTISSFILVVFVSQVNGDAFVGGKSTFVTSRRTIILNPTTKNNNRLLNIRGGDATAALDVEVSDDDLEIESSDVEDEYDEEEEEEEEVLDPKLAKSAQASAAKAKAKATATAKAAVNTKLEQTTAKAATVTITKKKSSSGGLVKLFKIPYIIKAVFNPIVLIQMTKGYFASLVNLNYLEQNKDPSQDLRSALEAKAKKGGGSSMKRGKRKMKPGQAKTLSDLPQLNT